MLRFQGPSALAVARVLPPFTARPRAHAFVSRGHVTVTPIRSLITPSNAGASKPCSTPVAFGLDCQRCCYSGLKGTGSDDSRGSMAPTLSSSTTSDFREYDEQVDATQSLSPPSPSPVEELSVHETSKGQPPVEGSGWPSSENISTVAEAVAHLKPLCRKGSAHKVRVFLDHLRGGHSRHQQQQQQQQQQRPTLSVADIVLMLLSDDGDVGPLPATIYTTLLRECDDVKSKGTAVVDRIIEKVVNDQTEMDSALFELCLWFYSTTGEIEKMDSVLSNFSHCQRGPVTYAIVVNHYFRSGQFTEAVAVLEAMRQQGVPMDAVLFRLAWRIYDKCDNPPQMDALSAMQTLLTDTLRKQHQQLQKEIEAAETTEPTSADAVVVPQSQRIWPHAVAFSCLIRAHARRGDVASLEQTFALMLAVGVRPTPVAFTTAVAVYCETKDWMAIHQKIEEMDFLQLSPEVLAISILLEHGLMDEALRLWDLVKRYGFCLSDISANVYKLMRRWDASARPEVALEVFEHAKRSPANSSLEDVVPQLIPHHPRVSATRWMYVFWIKRFAFNSGDSSSASSTHHPPVLKSATSAREVYADMMARRVPMENDTVVLNQLLLAFVQCGDDKMIERVLLDHPEVPRDEHTYAIVLDGFYKAGRTGDAIACLRQLYLSSQQQTARTPTGSPRRVLSRWLLRTVMHDPQFEAALLNAMEGEGEQQQQQQQHEEFAKPMDGNAAPKAAATSAAALWTWFLGEERLLAACERVDLPTLHRCINRFSMDGSTIFHIHRIVERQKGEEGKNRSSSSSSSPFAPAVCTVLLRAVVQEWSAYYPKSTFQLPSMRKTNATQQHIPQSTPREWSYGGMSAAYQPKTDWILTLSEQLLDGVIRSCSNNAEHLNERLLFDYLVLCAVIGDVNKMESALEAFERCAANVQPSSLRHFIAMIDVYSKAGMFHRVEALHDVVRNRHSSSSLSSSAGAVSDVAEEGTRSNYATPLTLTPAWFTALCIAYEQCLLIAATGSVGTRGGEQQSRQDNDQLLSQRLQSLWEECVLTHHLIPEPAAAQIIEGHCGGGTKFYESILSKVPPSHFPTSAVVIEALLNAGQLRLAATGWKHMKPLMLAALGATTGGSSLVRHLDTTSGNRFLGVCVRYRQWTMANDMEQLMRRTGLFTTETAEIILTAAAATPSANSSALIAVTYHDEAEEKDRLALLMRAVAAVRGAHSAVALPHRQALSILRAMAMITPAAVTTSMSTPRRTEGVDQPGEPQPPPLAAGTDVTHVLQYLMDNLDFGALELGDVLTVLRCLQTLRGGSGVSQVLALWTALEPKIARLCTHEQFEDEGVAQQSYKEMASPVAAAVTGRGQQNDNKDFAIGSMEWRTLVCDLVLDLVWSVWRHEKGLLHVLDRLREWKLPKTTATVHVMIDYYGAKRDWDKIMRLVDAECLMKAAMLNQASSSTSTSSDPGQGNIKNHDNDDDDDDIVEADASSTKTSQQRAADFGTRRAMMIINADETTLRLMLKPLLYLRRWAAATTPTLEYDWKRQRYHAACLKVMRALLVLHQHQEQQHARKGPESPWPSEVWAELIETFQDDFERLPFVAEALCDQLRLNRSNWRPTAVYIQKQSGSNRNRSVSSSKSRRHSSKQPLASSPSSLDENHSPLQQQQLAQHLSQCATYLRRDPHRAHTRLFRQMNSVCRELGIQPGEDIGNGLARAKSLDAFYDQCLAVLNQPTHHHQKASPTSPRAAAVKQKTVVNQVGLKTSQKK